MKTLEWTSIAPTGSGRLIFHGANFIIICAGCMKEVQPDQIVIKHSGDYYHEHCKPQVKHPERAVVSWNAVEVMERVAASNSAPEPSPEKAEAWLIKHEDGLTEAMQYAGMDYIRKYWEDQ